MSDLPSVPTERVVQLLCSTELGAALWQAATHKALTEVLLERIEQLEQQHKGE